MEKFNFLLGHWDMEYRVPDSSFHEAVTGSGKATFKKALGDKFVVLDYVSFIEGQQGEAHGIFVRDDKTDIYRYWWFEEYGAFMQASCKFINDKTLAMNWHNSVLVQTFQQTGKDRVVLRMEQPESPGKFELILEVIFTRK
ncbi:DUF1579 family protein [candidate division KSB1 bacterium]|nr:DUF1579 family protein [candidate division KSB1 bacterium]